MTWVRIDDRFTQHPKVIAAGPLAMAMQVAALGYCNRELTDGFIPRAAARTLLDFEVEDSDGRVWTMARTNGMQGDDVTPGWVIDCLVAAGMWEEVAGGYQIHDYLDYQPSKEEVLELREKRAEAGRVGGLKRGENWREANEAKPKQVAKQNPSKHSSKTEAKSKPTPVPTPVPVIPLPEPDPLDGAQDAPPKPKRAQEVPEDWQPTPKDREWALGDGFTQADIVRETPTFIRHHRSKGNVFKDVSAAWKNWMVRSREYRAPPRPLTNGHGPPRRATVDDILAVPTNDEGTLQW